ncbi:3-oxoacyl-[acyl-carrier-protein] synthase [Allomyces javanicus]|nr:3-oxoacyl-[acyl-carrier-protein] synthase [Allomyces javanicus]
MAPMSMHDEDRRLPATIKALVADFHRQYLTTSNKVHMAMRDPVGFPTETGDDDTSPAYVQVLAFNYAAVETLTRFLPAGEAADALAKLTKPTTPAFFCKPLQGQKPAAALAVFAVFGGQGTRPRIWTNRASARPVRNWLDWPARAPDADYLVAALVSMPLIAVTQFAWYLIMGMIPAVALAASDSESAFLANTLQVLTLLFHVGTQATLAFPPTSVLPRVTTDFEENGEGTPSPMLAVSGNLALKALRGHIDENNRHLPSDKQVRVALVNGPKDVVVAGPPQSLYGLNLRLRKVKTPAGKDEPRAPHHQRGVKFSSRFLPISAPFHSTYSATAVDRVHDLVQDKALGDLRTLDGADFAVFLTEEICTCAVDWELATAFKPTTHFVDFGSGGASGVVGLIHRNKEGSSAQIILALVFDNVSGMLGRLALLDASRDMIPYALHCAKEHRPQLVKVGDAVHLDTKFTRQIGRPPVMVAGMTPTTVSAQFVSATLNAGCHVELAGGGHFTETMLRDKVKDIMTRVAPGNAITINMMFLNPRQWAFQYPLVQALRREGYPVEGVCVAASVPSFEVAGEILTSLAACGIKHVAFKPGSADAIMQVVRIAEAHPNMPILLQWTGGRAVRDGHIAAVLERYYENSVAKVPAREYLTVFPTAVESVAADQGRDLISVSASGARRVLEVGAVVPARDQWLAAIAAAAPAWLRALIQAQHIVQGRMLADNYLPRLLAPRKHLTCTVSPAGLEITLHGTPAPELVIRRGEGRNVTVQLTHFFDDQQAHLELRFLYSPKTPYALVHEDLMGRNDRVKQFYADLWDAQVVAEEVRSVTTTHTVDRESIARFCKVIQNDTELFVEKGQDKLAAPLDYAIVAGWKTVVQPLFSTLIDGDLLKLVHLSNGFKVLAPGALVYAGDKISTKAEVASITNTPTGKKISVLGMMSREDVDLVEITSVFFVRGTSDDYHTAFDNVAEEPIKLTLRRAQDLAVFESKDYIQFDKESPVPIAVGSTLIFRLQTHVEYQSSTMYASLATTGTIEQLYKEQVLTVGRVAFECTHPLATQTSPVVAMLQRLGGVTVEQPTLFATGGYKVHATTFNAPATNTAYATVSGDYNPIHTAPLFADLAGLLNTITHGMWTSALKRRWAKLYAAENQPQRVVSFAVDFVDMCVPGTELTTTLRHDDMQKRPQDH